MCIAFHVCLANAAAAAAGFISQILIIIISCNETNSNTVEHSKKNRDACIYGHGQRPGELMVDPHISTL